MAWIDRIDEIRRLFLKPDLRVVMESVVLLASSGNTGKTATVMKRTALLVIDLQRGAFDGVRIGVIYEGQRLIDNTLASRPTP